METSAVNNLSASIKDKARELGFDLCGIAKSRNLEENGIILRKWCEAGMNGKINYLSRDIEKRINPAVLFPGAQSLVVTGLSYFSDLMQNQPDAPVISRYTYGKDYHDVISGKLNKLLEYIKDTEPLAEGRVFVDSGFILEKAWAKEAGLGWQGKHSVVINKKTGSFFFIGILVLNIELQYDEPFRENLCGNCRICIDECPTGAINGDRTIDTRKCIANLTIEGRGPVPEDILPKIGRRVYGCDKCQEVCPWNRHAVQNTTPEFKLSKEVAEMTLAEWQSLTPERFDRLFGNSAMSRVKYEKLMQNINLVTKSDN
jgi:epoxyqueuosine reductase